MPDQEIIASVSVDVLAELLVLTPRRVQQLVGQDVIIKAERGKYDLNKSIRGYIKYLNEFIPNKQVDGSTKSARLDTEAYRTNLMREKSILAKLSRMEKEGKLVDKDRERRAAFRLARSLRNSVMNIPARVAVKYAAIGDSDKIYRSLEKELIDSLEMIADMALQDINESLRFDAHGGEDCPHWCGK